jgi:hypothetical protein
MLELLLRFRILIAIAAIALALGAAYNAMHTTEGVVGVANGESPLSADQFRAPIANLEAHLFAPAPLTMEQRIVLATDFDEMRKALEAGSDGHLARFSAREIGTLAALSRGLGKLDGANLARVRQNWMRVRANTFDDASWFRFSEKDPVATPEEVRVPLAESDRAFMEKVRQALDRIDYTIERGEREVDRLGEPQPSGTVDDGVASAWRDWVVDWRAQMDRLRDDLPESPGPDVAMRVRFAWDSANRAIAELSAVPGGASSGGRPPYRVEWTRHFQNARRDVTSARDWIAKAEQGRSV